MAIPQEVIDRILDRIDIVEVVGSYIPLKRTGRNYKALCPFHSEKTSSFMVSQEKQIFHCFGCGEGGNVISFIMKYERLEFPEVVKMLAKKTGVMIPTFDKSDSISSSVVSRMYRANELAVEFYHNTLFNTEEGKGALRYLLGRGLKEETIRLFKLGYSPRRWDSLIRYLGTKGISPEILSLAGLAFKRSQDGGYFDRFRGRIMFPIFNVKGKVIGFGGRIYADERGSEEPKYMNSPETQIYNKSRNLYGLNFTWRQLSTDDLAIIVEGYLDMVIPYQSGIKNIIASLGTSLTKEQAGLIRRYTKNAVIVYDSDTAGELATLRSLDLLLEEGFSVSIVRLDKGFDPDTFVRNFGYERFVNLVLSSQNLFDYKLNLLKSRFDPERLEDKAKIVEEMLPTIYRVKNAVLQSGYIKSLSESLLVDEESIRIELKKLKPNYGGGIAAKPTVTQDEATSRLNVRQSEKTVAALLLTEQSFIDLAKEKIELEDFKDPVIRKIVGLLFKFYEEKKAIAPSKLINYLQEPSERHYIPVLVDFAECIVEKEKALKDSLLKFEQENLREKLNRLQVEIALAQDAADEERINRLVSKCNKLIRDIKECNGKAKEIIKEKVV